MSQWRLKGPRLIDKHPLQLGMAGCRATDFIDEILVQQELVYPRKSLKIRHSRDG